MKNISFFILCFFAFASRSLGQNVGIGTSVPTNKMHITGNTTLLLKLESTQDAGAEIVFKTSSGDKGYIGAYDNMLEMFAFPDIPIVFGIGNERRLTISSIFGNVGIGNSLTPPERLTIQDGNLQLSNSQKGIILNAADRPFITRGFDPFIFGKHNGLGRWGLFMEPQRLVLGMPSITGKGIEFSKYLESSARTTLLTIHSESGEMRRPGTGNVDLLPICIGSISVTGTIKGGSGNFTVFKDIPSGLTEITLTGISYNANDYAVIATCYADNGVKAYPVIVADNGKIRVLQYNQDGTVSNQAFSFMVYRLN